LVVDMSGSMSRWHAAVKSLVFNMRAALMQKYKTIKFVFIGFDGEAKVFDSDDDFFKTFLGGGTDYAVGYKKGREEFNKYPREAWDRFFVSVGDGENFGTSPQAVEILKDIYEVTEFSSHVQTGSYPDPALVGPMKDMHQKHEYFRYVEFVETPNGDLDVLKKLFGKTKQK